MTDLTVSGRTPAEYIRGAAYGLAAVGVWSGWIVVARLGLAAGRLRKPKISTQRMSRINREV